MERRFTLVERIGYRFLDWLSAGLERYGERQWEKQEGRNL